MNILYVVLIGLVFTGCSGTNPITSQEPVIRTVEVYIPVTCKLPKVIKPDYTGLNDVQKLYKDKEYSRALEARQIACDINTTK